MARTAKPSSLAISRQAESGDTMKPHTFGQMVNEVRDCARNFGQTQQLRDRLAEILGKYVAIEPLQPGCRVRLPGIGLCGDQYGAGSGKPQLCPECTMKQERGASSLVIPVRPNSEGLLPCAHCGDPGPYKLDAQRSTAGTPTIACRKCGARMFTNDPKDWNTRAP